VSAAVNNTQSSLYVQTSLSRNSRAMTAAIERLSSGLRIRQASDDAAGVGISEQMRQQLSGLSQGVQNAEMAVAAIQTSPTCWAA
jgi:flagellin